MYYNWQQKDWPNFTFEWEGLESLLYQYSTLSGQATGMLMGLPEAQKESISIDLLVTEALKTSEIEGEYISREDVLSSIRRNLGLDSNLRLIRDRKAKGVSWLMTHLRETYSRPMSRQMLFTWHAHLMESYPGITLGQWRSGNAPMQIVSGPVGREVIHFEAPPSERVPKEMDRFIHWFNLTAPKKPEDRFRSPIRSAIAHLYFETIHPFEDGNGRIGRAISEKALSQGANAPVILNLSHTLETGRSQYYDELKSAQRRLEISSWILFFVNSIVKAQEYALGGISFTLSKVKFFDRFREKLNPRQEKALQRMLRDGPEEFKGGMTAKKYIYINRTSKATATRDLQKLVEIGALIPQGGGRGTRYFIDLK